MSLVLLGILNSQAAGAGAGGDYHLLETIEPTTRPNSVTFSGISSYTDFAHLEIRAFLTGERNEVLQIRFNGDSGSNYRFGYIGSTGTSLSTYQLGGVTSQIEFGETFARRYTGAYYAGGFFKGTILKAFDTDQDKQISAWYGLANDYESRCRLGDGKWENTAAINSIELSISGGWAIENESRFSLYGIKG